MFGAIAGVLGNLFGTQKAGEKIIDGISNGVDKLVYTDEEKAEDAAKARSEGMQVYMKWLESTTGSRLARRFIATGVTGMWLVEQITGVILGQAAIFASNPDLVTKLTTASGDMFKHATENNTLVGVVLLFYFGGPAAIDGTKAMVEKWVNRERGE